MSSIIAMRKNTGTHSYDNCNCGNSSAFSFAQPDTATVKKRGQNKVFLKKQEEFL